MIVYFQEKSPPMPVLKANYIVFPSRLIWTLVFASLLILTISCNNTVKSTKKTQGFIEYEITYLQNSLKNIPTELLPKKMVFKFREQASIQKIDGFLGFFSIFHVVNPRKKINSTFLKIRNHKYCYPAKKSEIAVGFDKMEGMEITLLPDTKDIAGFKAKKAMISFPFQERNSFYIYYTDDIPIKKPNSSNPFHNINGVLLEFQLRFHNLDMQLAAKEVVFKPLQKKEFNIPDGYKAIPRNEMERIIGLLLE